MFSLRNLHIIKASARFFHRFVKPLRMLSMILEGVSAIAAVGCLASLIIYVGYGSEIVPYASLYPWLRTFQGVFITTILFQLIFLFRTTVKENRAVKWVVDCTMLLTLLPWIYPHPSHPWIPILEKILYSPMFLGITLGVYSLVIICFFAVKVIGRRVNPTLILAVSFLFCIALGSVLLMMPRCTVNGISYVDSFFLSTSAVCITGLTPVDISATLTPLGTVIMAVMMQVGALGVMTFTSVFALFFSGHASIYSQLMVKDMIYSKTINTLLPTLLLIMLFTLVIEAIGALAVLWSIHGVIPGMTFSDEIAFSAFHSLSAFCNAGFSTLPDGLSNAALMRGNQLIYLVTSVLVVAGGIGYPILVNARDALFGMLRRFWRKLRHRRNVGARVIHLMDLNTRVVLMTTAILLISGAFGFYLLECDHSMAGFSPWKKIVQSVFNAVTPRSAGFSSVAPSGFFDVTVFILLFLMVIGGGSQSTAGGVKVNAVAAVWLQLKATLHGRDKATAYNRTISPASVGRAQSVIILALLSYLVFSVMLMLFEPDLPAKMLLFESCSALFTVGSSLGATPLLGDPAKLLLCVAMFIGRMGLFSLLAGMIGSHRYEPVQFPNDNIIIS